MPTKTQQEINLEGGVKRKVYVHQGTMKENMETGKCEPCITVENEVDKNQFHGHDVYINGLTRVLQIPGEKGKMGRVFIETEAPIKIIV